MHELATALGADVSAQLQPGRWLATGAGEQLHELPAPAGELEVLLVPFAEGLSTARVYREADRLGAPRPLAELEQLRQALGNQLGWGAALPSDPDLLGNDLQAAAISLYPAIEQALAEVRGAGARLRLREWLGARRWWGCSRAPGRRARSSGPCGRWARAAPR